MWMKQGNALCIKSVKPILSRFSFRKCEIKKKQIALK